MFTFIHQLKDRNETLFYFGVLCLALAVLFFILTKVTTIQVHNVSAWFKPMKFALSTFFFSWAMAWYCHYLPSFNITLFNGSVIILLGFEIVYIAIQAGRGELSHYNVSTPFHSMMFSMMALAATLVTLYTAYVGFLFFNQSFPSLPDHYLWSIRMGILIFVVFSFQGFVMGSQMSHTVGLENDNSNLFIVGWSKLAGDLRIAHFIGMHALQVLPFLSFHVFKSTRSTLVLSAMYGLLAAFTLIQALQGKSLFQSN